MTRDEISVAVRWMACKLVQEHGIPRRAAYQMAARAALRAGGADPATGMGISDVNQPLVQSAVTTAPKKLTTLGPTGAPSPSILASLATAGDDPTVADARNVVSKWSWTIPVFGLLMSAKNKISSLRSPVAASMVGSRRR